MNRLQRLQEQLSDSTAEPDAQDALLDALEETLIASGDLHRLFDARMVRARLQLGLPITQPTSLTGIPREQEAAFRDAWMSAARDVGERLLAAGRLADAWAYFRTIDDPEPVRRAIENVPIPAEHSDETDELLHLALHEGAHIVRGLEILLSTHGTCNTVTAVSQLLPQMTPDERRQAAMLLVNRISEELLLSVRRDIERRQPLLDQDATIGQLIAGRDWLFADGNYHIDVSHLHSTVAFARHLDSQDPELNRAIDLCQYGSGLAEKLQYPADVPFDDYYAANLAFLKALAGRDVDESLAYFISRLRSESDDSSQRLIAFVLVDLGRRVDRIDEALDAAAPYLVGLEDNNGFSFTACCVEAGRIDLLEQCATEHDDVLAWSIARLTRLASVGEASPA